MPENTTSTMLDAKAKLNLRLVVKGLRSDGFHAIASVVHQIELADRVSVTLWSGQGGDQVPFVRNGRQGWADGGRDERSGAFIAVRCSPYPELGGQENIAYRAASGYLAAWSAAGGPRVRLPAVRIDIEKRIPVAGGLGGGSADAAAVLRALHVHLGPLAGGGTGLPGIDVAGLAAVIGSDVPFFLRGGAALVEGRGERVVSLHSTLSLPVLLAVPPFGVAAGQAYGWWDEDRGNAAGMDCWQTGPLTRETLSRPGFLRNDLAGPVAKRFPVVGSLMDAMAEVHAVAAGMTGSGPVVFGVFSDDGAAAGAEAVLRQTYRGVEFVRSRLDPGSGG